MLRIYKEFAGRLMLALVYAKYRGMSMNDLWQIGRDLRSDYKGQTGDALKMIFSHGFAEDLNVNEVLDELAAQYIQRVNGQGDTDLIDMIVRTLQLPNARNVISGKTLTVLRKALLLPDEMAVVNTRLKTREMSCNGCGHVLAPGEVCTYQFDGSAAFYCTTCVRPELQHCLKCGVAVGLPKNVLSAFSKPCYCTKHIGGKDAPKEEEAGAIQEPVLRGMFSNRVPTRQPGIRLNDPDAWPRLVTPPATPAQPTDPPAITFQAGGGTWATIPTAATAIVDGTWLGQDRAGTGAITMEMLEDQNQRAMEDLQDREEL